MDAFTNNLAIHFFNADQVIKFSHRKTTIKPQEFSLHLNDCVEFYIYISGQADYVVGDNRIELHHGDVIAISPYEIHTPVLKQECIYERFYILCPLDTFSGQSFNPLKFFSEKTERMAPRLPLTEKEKEKMLQILYALSALSKQEQNESTSLRSAGLILEFIGIITNAQSKAFPDTDYRNPIGIPPLVQEILTYISFHAESIDSVKNLADRFYISSPYLSTLFKKHVGINVNTYIRIKKVALAKKLLDQGLSVTDTCYRCGFSDCSHFIKLFKEYVGITPFRYKNKGL